MAEEILNLVGTDNEFMFQLKQAQSLFNSADSYRKFYAAEQSKIDLEQEDILHYMELREKMSGAELLKAACALRKIRHKRRAIKNKSSLAGILAARTTPKDKTIVSLMKDPLNDDKKTYNVRTNILKEVFGYEGKKI
jgi:hypothetical protein